MGLATVIIKAEGKPPDPYKQGHLLMNLRGGLGKFVSCFSRPMIKLHGHLANTRASLVTASRPNKR